MLSIIATQQYIELSSGPGSVDDRELQSGHSCSGVDRSVGEVSALLGYRQCPMEEYVLQHVFPSSRVTRKKVGGSENFDDDWEGGVGSLVGFGRNDREHTANSHQDSHSAT